MSISTQCCSCCTLKTKIKMSLDFHCPSQVHGNDSLVAGTVIYGYASRIHQVPKAPLAIHLHSVHKNKATPNPRPVRSQRFYTSPPSTSIDVQGLSGGVGPPETIVKIRLRKPIEINKHFICGRQVFCLKFWLSEFEFEIFFVFGSTINKHLPDIMQLSCTKGIIWVDLTYLFLCSYTMLWRWT